MDIEISPGSSSLWCPCHAVVEGWPALSPRVRSGWWGGSNLSRYVLGAGTFAPPFDPHPELSAATPGAPVPLGVGEALTAGLPSAGTGGVEGREGVGEVLRGTGLERSQGWWKGYRGYL